MSPTDIARGAPFGHLAPLRRSGPSDDDPRRELEAVVRRCLERPPCVVAFSGGRDSSAILALALHVARRDGLPEPVPVTRVFPDAPASDEQRWQELVIAHLGVGEWAREFPGEDMDILGPVARERLLRHGVVYSSLIHGDEWFLRHARGGSLLDGEGGDDVLDVAHRITPIAQALRAVRSRRRPTGEQLRDAGRAAATARRRARGYSDHLASMMAPWLREEAIEDLRRDIARDVAQDPLDARRSITWNLEKRSWHMVKSNRGYFAAQADVQLVSPFAERRVVEAIAGVAGFFGFGSRAESLRLLFGDLLPEELIKRRSKAAFNQAVIREHSRAFIARWDGDGVDPSLVDREVLRAIWNQDVVHGMSLLLLQSAWLHTTVGQFSPTNVR